MRRRRLPAAPPVDRAQREQVRIVPTGWATSYPQVADSAWLPPLADGLGKEVRRLGFELRRSKAGGGFGGPPCTPASITSPFPTALSAPEYSTSWPCSDAAQCDSRCSIGLVANQATSPQTVKRATPSRLIGRPGRPSANGSKPWVRATTAGGSCDPGRRADEQSARIRSPANPRSTHLSFRVTSASRCPAYCCRVAGPSPEPDWLAVLTSALKVQPSFQRAEQGADHEKSFIVTVLAAGRSASGTGPSAKAARAAALREYVTRYLPGAVPRPAASSRELTPRTYPSYLASHAAAVQWVQQAFEIADPGLVTQALTHSSWANENKALVAAAGQRDFRVLATEGSEVLTYLVRHQHALQMLNSSFRFPPSEITSPAVTDDVVAQLFDAMPVEAGVLRSRGTNGPSMLSSEVKANVAQAIVAAAWRVNGDQLAERQGAELASWITGFTPPADPSTQLQEYCSRAKIEYTFGYERRGPDHLAEYRATIAFDLPGRPTHRGEWTLGKTPAKHSAAERALDELSGDAEVDSRRGSGGNDDLVRSMLLAELRSIDPGAVNPEREIANGTLRVDRLVAGDYDAYARWAKARAGFVATTESAVTERLTQFYEAVLIGNRREAVRKWIVGHTPAQGGRSVDPAARMRAWWGSTDPGRLALLAELLPVIVESRPPGSILDFVENQARSVANAAKADLEVERTDEADSCTMTIRVEGTQFSDAVDPVVALLESVGVGAAWAREPHAVSLTLPIVPTAGDLITVAAGSAVNRAVHDPWLHRVQGALGDFLAMTEQVFGTGEVPSARRLDEMSLAELSLVLQLRSTDEEE